MLRYVGRIVRLFALIIISLSLVACGRAKSNLSLPDPSGSMIEITQAYPGVGMVVIPEGAGICTGTVVGEKVVLTAAHCVLKAGRYAFRTSKDTYYTYNRLIMGSGSVDDPHDIALLVFDSTFGPEADIHRFDDKVESGDTIRLVGLGCSNLETRRGAGTKRTGTNVVAEINDYINFLTPRNYARGILGPINRAGSCFGDSGGPAFSELNGELKLVGVTHAGGYLGDDLVSEYINVANHSANRNWLRGQNQTYQLGMQGI